MLCVLEIIIPIAETIKQDAWISENPSEPPVAVLMFTFTSKGGFFANSPIHVRIQMWLTVGENYSNIVICFPDAYAYPRNQTPGKPPNAGWIPIPRSGNLTGEGDIEFTSSGSFGYIIYSEEKPVYYAAEQQIIHVSLYENLVQIRFAADGIGVTLISIGVAILALPKIIEKTSKKSKQRTKRK